MEELPPTEAPNVQVPQAGVESPIQESNQDYGVENQMNDVVQSFIDRLLKQERELEKMELKCRAYERILRTNKEKLKYHSYSIDEPQNPKEDQIITNSDRTPNLAAGKRYILNRPNESGASGS